MHASTASTRVHIKTKQTCNPSLFFLFMRIVFYFLILLFWNLKGGGGVATPVTPFLDPPMFEGYAGGSWWNDPGAASEYVCLPPDPDLVSRSYPSYYATMHGAEYDEATYSHDNGDDLPCAVCRSTKGTSVLMIPGKYSCYDGWTMQYHGNLVAGAHTFASSTQFICLDNDPQALPSGSRNDDGKLFYPVFAKCGALACPPYHDGKTLTCSVCSK